MCLFPVLPNPTGFGRLIFEALHNGPTIALFSGSEQTHCGLVLFDSERVTVALHSAFWISTRVVAALF